MADKVLDELKFQGGNKCPKLKGEKWVRVNKDDNTIKKRFVCWCPYSICVKDAK
jgi:hypothetical protein